MQEASIGADTYAIEGAFECAVVYYLSTSRAVPYRFLPHISKEMFTNPHAQRIVEQLIKYYKRTSRVPGSIAATGNLITQLYNRGKITKRVKMQTIDYLESLVWAVVEDEKETAAQFADVVHAKLHYEATKKAIGLQFDRKPISEVADLIRKADTILLETGEAGTHASVTDVATWVAVIKESGVLHRTPTGIFDWDVALDGGYPRGTLLIIIGPTGAGKCHRKGTEVVLADGTLRKVEDVKIGDKLAGPSGPRTVLQLGHGHGEMFEVRPIKGDSWYVNEDHVLSLVCTHTPVHSRTGRASSVHTAGNVIDVSVRDWMKWSKTQKHLYKLFQAPPTEFAGSAPDDQLPVPPYILGVLLGDGSVYGTPRVTTPDNEIIRDLDEYATWSGLRVTKSGPDRSAPTYYLSTTSGPTAGSNILINKLRDLGVWEERAGDKHVPDIYLRGSVKCRREILAGLIDTDGHLTNNCYDWISKSKQLATDFCFIARSLGIRAQLTETRKGCQTGTVGTYYRVSLSGSALCDLNLRVTRKRIEARSQKKDALRTGFDVIPTGKCEPYYGFLLDGDGRYMISDFTVTHNSVTLSQMCASAVLRGLDAAYISLEIDKSLVAARVMAPIAGLPIDFVIKRTDAIQPYLLKTFKRCQSTPGELYIEHFPEGILASECLVALDRTFEEAVKKGKRRPTHFYFDYLDRFGGGATRGKKGYERGGDITQTLHNYINHWNAWGASACQSKRFASKAAYKESGVDDVADSMEKVRIATIVINLLFIKDGPYGDEIASKISKHRVGRAGYTTAFQPADYSYGTAFNSYDFKLIPKSALYFDPSFTDLVALEDE